MKKLVLISLGLVVFSRSFASSPQIVSMDKRVVFERSKEGKEFFGGYEKKKQAAEAEIEKLQKDVQATGERLQKQAQMLSRDAFMERQKDFARKVRKLERDKEERQQDLKMEFQEGYERVLRSQLAAAEAVRKDKGALLLVDRGEPGVISVASETDISEDIIKFADREYEKKSKQESKGA